MNKQKLTALVVLQVATELIAANGSTTTLDVKRKLRQDGTYEAFQDQISRFMMELFSEGKLASTNDSSRPYQIYDLPKATSTPAVPQDNIFQKIVQVLMDKLGSDSEDIVLTASLDDLGTDELDRVEIIMDLERELNVSIPDDIAEGFKTVQDIYDYLNPQAKASSTSPKADEIQKLLTKGNPVITDIIIALTTQPTITRKEIKEAKSFTDSQVDTALSSLVKKGIIIRTAPGTYSSAPSVLQKNTQVNIPDAKEKRIQELEQQLQEKEKELTTMKEKIQTGLTHIESAHKELINTKA